MFDAIRSMARERMDICRSCPEFRPKTERCGVCGCFMRAKTLMQEQSCPQDKWGPYHA